MERISNYILEIFDEEGNFGHSEWNGDVRWGKGVDEIGAWEFSYASISLTVPPKTSPYLPEGDTLVLQPSLSLEPFGANDARFPRNGADKKTPVPLPVSPGSPPPRQYVYYDPDQAQLVWVRPDLRLSLRFTQPKAALRGKAQELGVDPWSNTFVHSVPQWSLPLAGWDPSELDDPVYGRAIAGSGTGPTKSSDGQPLDGNPIFAVPELDSGNYGKYPIGEQGWAALPSGTRLDYQPHAVESKHSEMLSSTHELVNSWTLTLGLSAGIEKILSASVKGSYHEKITYQQEHETRYSLSRRVKTEYVLFTDIPNLRLDSQFADVVLANLKRLNTGDPLEWEDFVQNYGTHYVHAITCGQTDFVEMRFSLDAECTAREKGWKLEEKAQASLEGIKFGEEAGVGHDWSTKDGFKVSSEDVTHITVGEQGKPAAIFLDLRPLWEIFSPVFFPPNLTVGAVPKKAVAPWIWHELRSSFRQYLEETAGVNKELDPSNETDYAPRFVKVTFPEFKIWHGSGSICMYGNVQLFPTNDGVEYVNAQYWSVSPDQSQRVANGSDLPALDKLTATFGVTPKIFESGGGFILSFRLYDWQPLPGGDPNIENTKTYSFKSGGGVFEWHGDEGWGHKISYKVEPV